MARHIVDIPTGFSPEELQAILSGFCSYEKFEFVNINGEYVYKKGNGWIAAPQFLKVTCFPGVVRIEAWIKYSLLPGVHIGEMGLGGFYGIGLKNLLRQRVDKLSASIAAKPPIMY